MSSQAENLYRIIFINQRIRKYQLYKYKNDLSAIYENLTEIMYFNQNFPLDSEMDQNQNYFQVDTLQSTNRYRVKPILDKETRLKTGL